MKRIFTIVLLTVLVPFAASARPQYAVLGSFGAKCEGCHNTPNTGMARTTPGWMSQKDISLLKPEQVGLGKVFETLGEKNTILDEKVTFGLDFRYQTARWASSAQKSLLYPNAFDPNIKDTLTYSDPYATKRDYMIMVFTPYVTINPIAGVTIQGSYNLAYDIEKDKRYPGQQAYTANITYKPFEWAPALSVGYLQPTVGMDWDDHTYITRQIVEKNATYPVVPCDYIEMGAQLDYNSLSWLGVTLGVYDSKNLALLTRNVTSDKTMSGLAKVTFYPPDFGTGLTAFMGGSLFMNSRLKSDNGIYFANKYFSTSSVFLSIGKPGVFAIMSEWMKMDFAGVRTTNNFTVELDYLPIESVIGYVRVERGNTELAGATALDFHANKYTLGAKIFLLPYIALIPEYKIYDRTHVDSYASQFACQLHLFY